jgi:hypothetical protein
MAILKIKDENGVFKGIKTIKGESATIKIGTVTTGQPGTDAKVENVGTQNDAVFNFTIPRGKNGAGTNGGVTDYGSLDDLPTINGVTLVGDMRSEDILGKTPVYFDNFEELKKYSKAELGQVLITLGYFSPGDNGGSTFVVKNTNYEDDDCSVITFENGLQANLIMDKDSIMMPQLGFLPNIYTQDCRPAILKYIDICKRDNKQYELYIPDGTWCFSETDIYVGIHKGVKIRGVSPQTGYGNYGNTVIMPFNDNQEYIWNLGETAESTVTSLNGCNILKDLQFTTGNAIEHPKEYIKSFCKVGLLLTFTCYSYFDGLYFRYFNGTGMAVQNGWENHFGYLNFRLCGYFDKEQTYCPLWIKRHPIQNPGSGFSANFFEYINFEGINGSCIYFEPGVSIVHCEFGDIQVEWSKHDNGGWNPDMSVTYQTDTISWDDESENIEHIYIIKGQSGSYNSICFNTISVSGCNIAVWTATYTDEEGNTITKYKRQSGIFGPDEVYKSPGNSLNVIVSKLTGIGGSSDFPAFHGVDMANIYRTNVNIGVMHGLKLLAQTKNLIRGTITQNNAPKNYTTTNDGKVFYFDDVNITSGGYIQYDSDSMSAEKMSLKHGDYEVSIDGSKQITLRLKFLCKSIDEFPDRAVISLFFKYKDGTTHSAYVGFIYKTDIEAGLYPINEWFDYKITYNKIAFDDVIVRYSNRVGDIYLLDCIKISSKNRTVIAADLTNPELLKSAIGAQAWCTDRRETAEDELGVMMVFNGTEWKSIKGTKLTDLLS